MFQCFAPSPLLPRSLDRSPRPDGQYSPKLDDDSYHRDGYSSASPSPRVARSLTDPWGDVDLEDERHSRSASQPRTVSRDDHHNLLAAPAPAAASSDALSANDEEGSAEAAGGRGNHRARQRSNAVPGEDLGGVVGPRGPAGAEALATHPPSRGRPVSLPLPSAGGFNGGGGGGISQWNPKLAALAGAGSQTYSARPGGSSSGRSSPEMMGDAARLQEAADGWGNRRDSNGGNRVEGHIGSGSTGDHHRLHHGGASGSSRGRNREVMERAGPVAGERPRSLHHLDRRYFAEDRRHFAAEEQQAQFRHGGQRGGGGGGGSAAHVHGMIGTERVTPLRGFKDVAAHSASRHGHGHGHHHPSSSHHQQPSSYPRMHRASSDGHVVATANSQRHYPNPHPHHADRGRGTAGSLRGGGRYQERGGGAYHDPHQHQHQSSQYPPYRGGGGADGSKFPPHRAAEEFPGMGEHHHSHHHQQPRPPHHRYGGDSQQHQLRSGGGGSRGSGSGGLSLGPRGPELVMRKSDGGVVVSSAAYHQQGAGRREGGGSFVGRGGGYGVSAGGRGGGSGGGSVGMGGAGGVRHGSSTSLADGDISFNVSFFLFSIFYVYARRERFGFNPSTTALQWGCCVWTHPPFPSPPKAAAVLLC